MGQVFEAEHVLLGRKTALKMVLTDLADDEEFRVRLIRESQAVASIDHPNIIPIYDAGELDGTAYIAMRFVQGYDLATLLERRHRLEPAEALWILDQAGAALDAAHARRLVHRDIKPANILIEEDGGRVYLTDFGIVMEQGRVGMTRPGFFLGTIDYAAPEQIEGKQVGPRADLYAFGCVLFECLCGSKPFTGSMDTVIRAHVLDPPPRLSAVRTGLPAALDAVIERALAKNPEDRFESCRALVEAARMALGAAGGVAPASAASGFSAAALADASGGFPTVSKPARAETSLPVPTAPLIGREQELGEVVALLRAPSARLVTLTGFGGTGKTRLSLGAAAALQAEFDLVVFVELSTVEEPTLVPSAVARTLGCSDSGERPLVEAIRDRIDACNALLVLDNFEQVISAAPFAAELLAAVPTLKLLVTSQMPLRISGEHEYAVPPLSLPLAASAADLPGLLRIPAVALFVERARAVRPDFELTEGNALAVADICTWLDGIPLAIELAAARVKLLQPQALRGRLQRRLDLLTGGSTDLPERQQTLRGAIDWSVGLLDEVQQAVLARLGTFVGGCSLEAAEVVVGEPLGLGIGELVDSLTALADKSLARHLEGADGEPRFSMLETIREYALDRLAERGELEEARRLHAAHFLEVVETAEPELARANQAVWLERLDQETGNIRTAITWALEAGETELALRFGGALVRFWSIRGYMSEGREWLHDALENADGAPFVVRARAEFAAGYGALGLGELSEAESHFRRSLEFSSGNTGAEAAARAQLAWIAMTSLNDGDTDVAGLATASLRGAREVDDKRTAAGALGTLAELALRRGDTEEALALLDEGLALRRGLGDARLIANSLLGLARVRLARAEPAQAEQLLEAGLAQASEIGDTWSASVALAGLGRLKLDRAAPAEAGRLFADSLRLASGRGDKRAVADCLQGLAGVRALEGRPDEAAGLLGAADGVLAAMGAELTPAERALDDRIRPQLQAELGEEFGAKLAAGGALSLDETVAAALAVVTLDQTGLKTPV